MAYDTVANIVSDAAAELGLGTVSDVYGSLDANVIQLRTLLKSLGKDLVKTRDWTHLVREYSFVTRPNWVANTSYTSQATSWGQGVAKAVGAMVKCAGGASTTRLYICTAAGTTSVNNNGPTGTGTAIVDGTCTWKYLNDGLASVVVKGLNYYTCTAVSGTSGTVGPVNISNSLGDETDGTTTWTYSGSAADYSLPSDFSNMLDQTDWNRTNRLPLGGPVDAQTWQYLKGRQQGVVFNVLFRQVAGILRLYPDTDTPGGYTIAFEYISNSWVSATGGTSPTTNVPTANTDIIYFDRDLILSGLKLLWLQAKGFDTSHAQREYDTRLERAMNIDTASPVLNLGGRRAGAPLLGGQNIPITGYGQ